MTFGTTLSLLTLGKICASETRSAAAKANVTRNGLGKWTVTNKVGTVNDLFVTTKTKSHHTITFNGTYKRLNVDTSKGGFIRDSSDNLTFNGNISNSKVTSGSSSSSAGDAISFKQNATNTAITTSGKNDSIVFSNSNTDGSTINAGLGADSIRFLSSSKVGESTTVNLGGSSTGDGARDIIFVANKTTLAGSNIRINNFVDGVDQIRVGATTLNTKAAANAFFDNGIVFG